MRRNRLRAVQDANEAEIIAMIRRGMSDRRIAVKIGVHRSTVQKIRARRGLRPIYESLEYSPLHDKPYCAPKCIPSTLPVCQASQCSDEIIERFMGCDESVSDEIYRTIAQFQAGKEPSRPELVIASFECSSRRGTGTVGFEPAATPKS